MKRIKKLVATVGKYTDNQGQEKNRYQTVGSMFKRDDGTFALKIDCIPVGEFNGWLGVYDLDERKQAPQQQAPSTLGDDPPW